MMNSKCICVLGIVFLYLITSVSVPVLSGDCHDRSVLMSSLLSWLSHHSSNYVLSSVLQFWEVMEVTWGQVFAVWWMVKGSEMLDYFINAISVSFIRWYLECHATLSLSFSSS